MMYGSDTTNTEFTYYIYMPSTKSWDVIEPSKEIVEVRFPGFLIIKHKELQDCECKGLERLKKVLSSTVRSVYT